MRLERQKLPAPELLGLFEPVLQSIHWLGRQPVDAHARVQPSMLFGNKTTCSERSQVAAHRGRADARKPCELSRRLRSLAQKLDHLAALRIGECGHRSVEGRWPGGGLCQ